MVLNVRHVNYYLNHIYTVSKLFGYIEKYDLEGNFVNHLDLHSITPLFHPGKGYLGGPIPNTKICNGKLFIMSGIPADKIKNYVDIPDNISFVICLIKVDVSKEDMVLEKVYYYFPQEREEVMIKGVFSFVMLDENTFVQSTAKSLELYNLK
ncbi:MAG: hypothetical protein JXQ65_16655 [Candidatus Marinimicrobia bacterium]|nr:hypothetical protein [Candidatus Neomarinimicrobiota bacterium]